VAKGDLAPVVWFDLVEAEKALDDLMLIAKSASQETRSIRARGVANIEMKSTVRNHGLQMRGILNNFSYESKGFGSRPGLSFQQVEQTTVEILGTLKLMCDELSKYLEVVPGVVQKQMLLCETADRVIKQMRSLGNNDGDYGADSKSVAVKNVLGHVVS